jgi:hypothetical protein
MPIGLFTGARRAYVKLERRFGFFDEAGWHPIALRIGAANVDFGPVRAAGYAGRAPMAVASGSKSRLLRLPQRL